MAKATSCASLHVSSVVCVIVSPHCTQANVCAFFVPLSLVQVWVSGWVSTWSTYAHHSMVVWTTICTPWFGSMVSTRTPWYVGMVFTCKPWYGSMVSIYAHHGMVIWCPYAQQLLIVWVTLSAPSFDSETGVDCNYLKKTTQVVFVLALLRLE